MKSNWEEQENQRLQILEACQCEHDINHCGEDRQKYLKETPIEERYEEELKIDADFNDWMRGVPLEDFDEDDADLAFDGLLAALEEDCEDEEEEEELQKKILSEQDTTKTVTD